MLKEYVAFLMNTIERLKTMLREEQLNGPVTNERSRIITREIEFLDGESSRLRRWKQEVKEGDLQEVKQQTLVVGIILLTCVACVLLPELVVFAALTALAAAIAWVVVRLLDSYPTEKGYSSVGFLNRPMRAPDWAEPENRYSPSGS